MKKKFLILTLIFAGALVALYSGCEEDPIEECVQEEICPEAPEVTACCTDGADCVFTYNGYEYPDTDEGYNRLIDSLGCGSSKKSESLNKENDYLFSQLQSLLEKARELSKR